MERMSLDHHVEIHIPHTLHCRKKKNCNFFKNIYIYYTKTLHNIITKSSIL